MPSQTREMLQPKAGAREPQARLAMPGSGSQGPPPVGEAKRPPPKAQPSPLKPASLKKAREFQYVRQHGRSTGTALLTLGWASNGLDCCRCGYAVGKRVGGAVTRNRIKRRLREIIRLEIKAGQVVLGYDLVFIARTGAAQATYQQLAADVLHMLQRAHLWRAAPPEGIVPS